ncbi:MAG: hypothetical protein II258_07260, partial [Spirochaetales bacterium]|nr:hypothetical protein [Spirochaetales bacterium]
EFYDENGEKQKSGSYATKDKIINIRITPHHFEDDTYRKISQVSYSLDGKTEKSLELGQYSGGYYSIPLKVSTLGENVSGDVTLQIKALDETNNDSPGTLYFIVDNEAPNGLSITSPMLKDKTFITDLTDDVAKINENDISYYQNQEMILKGTISDNYRINEAVLDFCKADGTLIHSVTLTYDEEGKLSVSDEKGIVTASSGIPGNFTLKIDTTKFDDGNYILKTTAYDAAGNSETWGDGETDEYYFKVLQEADKPRIIYNIDFDSEGKTVIFPETTLKGAVIDDDAIAEKGLRYIVLGEADNLPEEKVKEKFDASNDSDVKILKNIKSFTRQNWEIGNPEIDNPEIDNPKFKNVGTYYLYMEVKDNNGTKSEIYKKTIVVSSTEKPYIKSITAEKGTGGESNGYYSGNVNISVKAIGGEAPLSHIMFRITTSNSNEENNDTIKVDDAENSINFNVTDNANLEKWHKYTFREQIETTRTVTFSFDSKLFVAGKTETINVEVKCIANNVESQIVREKILIDNEGPTLQIASPVANASVNKKIEISVSCNDRGAGVEAVYVSYQTTPTKPTKLEDITSNLAESADSTRGKWYKLENIDGISWIGEFNSEIIHPEASEHSYDFTVATVDMLGNITFTQQPIKINQDLDRPIVRLQNLNLSTGGTILHKSGFIYGTISDDDGGNDIEIYVSENGVLEANDEEWGKNLYSNGSWEYTFNGDGEKKLAFKVVDSKGTTFISADNSGLTVPKIVDSTAQNQAASKFTIIVDTESPEMTDVYFNAEPNTEPGFPTSKDVDTSVWSNSFSEKTFGGTEKKIWFLIGGTDENGIKGCTLTATDQNSGVDIPDPNDTNRIKTAVINGTSFYKYEIGISKVTLTSLNFKIVMEDNSGLTTQKSFTVNIDNTAPTVSITSHSDGNSVYGTESNTIKGIVGEKDSTVEYALTTDSASPDVGDYIEIGNSSNWEIVFKDNDILNNKIKNLYNVTGKFEDSYDLYVWLKATD